MILEEKHQTDFENMHMKYFQEGYRECILTQLYGENKVFSEMQIDTDRYSHGSAKYNSYQEGWESASQDLKK